MNDLSPQAKRELLARLLRERAARGARAEKSDADTVRLRPIPRTDAMELSFVQERIWALEQVRPEARNNILLRFGLQGPLDVEVLRRTIEAIVARHEVLRTTIPTVDGQPVQRIASPGPWPLPVVDLSRLDKSVRDAEERGAAIAEANFVFDLAAGPLLRSLLLRLNAQDYILLLSMHHIVSDGWSVDLMFQELAKFYEAFATGQPVPLAPLPIQYADFAHWQRRWLTGAPRARLLEYWKKQLAGPPPMLDLPFDRAPSASRRFEGASRRFEVDPAVLEKLRELSRSEGVTLYTTLLTAIKALLGRYASQDDITVGTVVAGRTRIELEPMMGCFVNTLALRSDFSGDPTFRTALHRTRDVVLQAQAHAELPFDMLVAEMRPERDLARGQFFEVLFNMQSFDFDNSLSCAGLRISGLSTLEYFSVADTLTFFGYDRRKQLDFAIVYSPELFDASTIARLESHFTRLLAGIVRDPDQRLSALPLMSPEEERDVIALGEGRRVAFAVEHGYAHYFGEQMKRTPHALAVMDDDSRLTYAELNERANAVARLLIAQGIGAGEPVGMCSERNTTLLTWILGAFKAGAAYMPLDARYPPARHAAMLRQSRARLVLCQDRLAAEIATAIRELPSESRPRVLTASEMSAPSAKSESASVSVSAGPQDLAYILFTSGSTGTPKGAMVSHAAMLNHFWAKLQTIPLGAQDVVAQLAPIGFDISLWQFLAVLLAGGVVRIAPETAVEEPERFFDLLRQEPVTVAQVVPSFLRAFLDGAPSGQRFARLRALLLVGEALPPELARRWFERWPEVPLTNGYGPSECADEATRQVLTRPPGEGELSVPIGRAIDNVHIHILDRAGGLLPQGIPGELCIAGAGVGLGYLNDPERTASSFVKDPFDAASARMYRTGDRAKMRADGVVEFLGRLDFQMKIRGHRLEAGEIEAVLERHPSIRQAIVQLSPSPSGDRLAAYVVPADPLKVPTTDELRAHAGAMLPSYMVPEAFVTLATLPLNANGKVNRRALPALTAAAAPMYVAPRTPMETAVAQAWSTLLKQPRIGVHDNFFELGGHSLLAAQAAARMRVELGVEISVRVLFEKQTVAELARHLESEKMHDSMREELTL